MLDHRSILRVALGWPLHALLGATVLAWGAPWGHAQPTIEAQRPAVVQSEGSSAGESNDAMLPFEEINAALAAARVKLEELTGAAEIATITAGLRHELGQFKQDNQRLRAEIGEANHALGTARSRLEQAEAKLASKDEALAQLAAKDAALVEAAQRSAAQVARLRDEVKTAQEELAAAEASRNEAEASRLETLAALELSEALADRLRAEVVAAQQERDGLTADLARAAREQGEVQANAEALRATIEDLQQQLVAANGEIQRLDGENASMQRQVAQFRDAADAAADAARQNLATVEAKIRMLNEALADVLPGAGPAEVATASGPHEATAATAMAESDSGTPVPPVVPAQRVPQHLATPQAPARDAVPEGRNAPPPSELPRTLAQLTAELPLEERVQVENLLADLKAEQHAAGLLMTVPGGELFATASDKIEESAHDTLSRVAELISIYGDRQVLILGHTDAIGDAGYNKALSERRADLVKQFFVEHFEIEPLRLSTAGLGKERPIASNATRAGRQANRRVEVLIMN